MRDGSQLSWSLSCSALILTLPQLNNELGPGHEPRTASFISKTQLRHPHICSVAPSIAMASLRGLFPRGPGVHCAESRRSGDGGGSDFSVAFHSASQQGLPFDVNARLKRTAHPQQAGACLAGAGCSPAQRSRRKRSSSSGTLPWNSVQPSRLPSRRGSQLAVGRGRRGGSREQGWWGGGSTSRLACDAGRAAGNIPSTRTRTRPVHRSAPLTAHDAVADAQQAAAKGEGGGEVSHPVGQVHPLHHLHGWQRRAAVTTPRREEQARPAYG